MIVNFIDGNLFESNAQTVVNTVNCVGIMGRGVALKFKTKYPEMFNDYVKRCYSGQVNVGKPYIWKESTPWILNFPTKNHWRDPSKIEYITTGLDYLVENYKSWGITSLASPALGCGLGGLDWNVISLILNEKLTKLEIPVTVYKPIIGYRRIIS